MFLTLWICPIIKNIIKKKSFTKYSSNAAESNRHWLNDIAKCTKPMSDKTWSNL